MAEMKAGTKVDAWAVKMVESTVEMMVGMMASWRDELTVDMMDPC